MHARRERDERHTRSISNAELLLGDGGFGLAAHPARAIGIPADGAICFEAAEARYTAAREVDTDKLRRWLAEARDIQWDCRNLIRRKGRLQRLT